MAKADEEEEHQKQQGEKPFCAVHGTGKNGEQQQGKWSTRRKGGGGGPSTVHIQQQFDENSYLSRTRNIFGSGDEEGGRAMGQQNINALNLFVENNSNNLLTTNSPFRILTTLTHCENSDWDELREVRVRELSETRQRVALMENTMRWWLSAAEQWREKWQKLKSERCRLRDENLRLRNALSYAKIELFELEATKRCKSCAATLSGNIDTNKSLLFCSPKIIALPKCGKTMQKEKEQRGDNKATTAGRRRRRRTK